LCGGGGGVGAGGGPVGRAATDIVVVLERPVLVHLPLGLGPRRCAAAVEHHGLLHPDDGPAVGGVDGPGRARRLPVTRRRRSARPPAPRLLFLPRTEEEPRLPLPGAAPQPLVNLCTQSGMPRALLIKRTNAYTRACFDDTNCICKAGNAGMHGSLATAGRHL
jgi:hypothetical protein